MSFLPPFIDGSALAIPLNRLRVTSRSAGHQDGVWAECSGLCHFFFSLFGVFADLLSGFSLRRAFSFFSDGLEFFSHPPSRKMWLLEPIGIRRGVLSPLRLVHFFLNFERTASGSVRTIIGDFWQPFCVTKNNDGPTRQGRGKRQLLKENDICSTQLGRWSCLRGWPSWCPRHLREQ